MNKTTLVFYCQIVFWPLQVSANSWDDLVGSSSPGPIPGPICKGSQLCLQESNQALSKQDTTEVIRIKNGDLEDLTVVAKVNSAVSAADKEVKLAALRKLTQKPGVANVATLVTATQGTDIEVRRMSMYLLGKTPSIEGKAALHSLLSNKSTPTELKVYSAKLLGELAHTDAISDLQRALSDPNDELSIQSAIALAKLGDQSGLEILYNSSQSESHGEGLREKSILALELLAGKQFGYTLKYYAPVTKRQKEDALAYIRAWWSTNYSENTVPGGVK